MGINNNIFKKASVWIIIAVIAIAVIIVITLNKNSINEKQYQFPLSSEDIEEVLTEQGIDMFIKENNTVDNTRSIATLSNDAKITFGIDSQVRENHKVLNFSWYLPKTLSSDEVYDFFRNDFSKQLEMAGIFYGNKKGINQELNKMLKYYLDENNYDKKLDWNEKLGNDHLKVQIKPNHDSQQNQIISLLIIPDELYEDYLRALNNSTELVAMDVAKTFIIDLYTVNLKEVDNYKSILNLNTTDEKVLSDAMQINDEILKSLMTDTSYDIMINNRENIMFAKASYEGNYTMEVTDIKLSQNKYKIENNKAGYEFQILLKLISNDGAASSVPASGFIELEIIDDKWKVTGYKNNEDIEKPNENDDVDRTEYLTGEIITDGIYSYPSNYKGVIYFVPDEESDKIIKEKYNYSAESYILFYENISITKNLPKELGIYKVKVKVDWNENGKSFSLNDIQLTDKIGTVLYKGKTYETNELDENVKVKDKVCGLIVKWISKDIDGGIQIRFAGEIESEGYYSINYNEMYDDNMGRIYFADDNFNNIPFYGERGFSNFNFFKTNELFDELIDFSAFGKGKFKTSNYILIYNIGMGRPVSDYLTEIVSLDEAYKDMFIFDKNKFAGLRGGINNDFVIVSSANYDEHFNHLSTDYYYINKKNPEKLFLFSSGSYNYELKVAANENEFTLSTDGYNYMTGDSDKGHLITFQITENGIVTEKIGN